MDAFHLPPLGFGPGSQPPADEDEALSYLALPQDMRTFAPHIPEVADAARFAPVDGELIPTGDPLPVTGTRHDWRQGARMGERYCVRRSASFCAARPCTISAFRRRAPCRWWRPVIG